jgi:hypothetical protein
MSSQQRLSATFTKQDYLAFKNAAPEVKTIKIKASDTKNVSS